MHNVSTIFVPKVNIIAGYHVARHERGQRFSTAAAYPNFCGPGVTPQDG